MDDVGSAPDSRGDEASGLEIGVGADDSVSMCLDLTGEHASWRQAMTNGESAASDTSNDLVEELLVQRLPGGYVEGDSVVGMTNGLNPRLQVPCRPGSIRTQHICSHKPPRSWTPSQDRATSEISHFADSLTLEIQADALGIPITNNPIFSSRRRAVDYHRWHTYRERASESRAPTLRVLLQSGREKHGDTTPCSRQPKCKNPQAGRG